MRQTNAITFWLHYDPNGTGKFNEIFKSRTEPFYDLSQNQYVLTTDGHLDGDRFVILNPIAKAFLPPDLLEQIKPGMKARVTLQGTYELKDKEDAAVEPVQRKYNIHEHGVFEVVPFTDRLIFAKKGHSKLYERSAVIYIPQADEEHPIKEQFIHKDGNVIEYFGGGSIYDHYAIIGHVGNVITPKNLGDLWASDFETDTDLFEMLREAYRYGLRFQEAPKRNIISFDVSVIDKDIFTIDTDDMFYGFGGKQRFCTKRNFNGDVSLKARSLERVIVNALLAYRWFFAKPNLTAKFTLVHDKTMESPKFWTSEDKHREYMAVVENFQNKTFPNMVDKVSNSLESKWSKQPKKELFFDPTKVKDIINKVLD